MQTQTLPIVPSDAVDVMRRDNEGVKLLAAASDLGWAPGYWPNEVLFRPATGLVVLARVEASWSDVVTYEGPGVTVDVMND